MNSFLFSIFVLTVWSQIALGNGNDKKEILEFDHAHYVIAVKENHKINKGIFTVRAHGCGNKITYRIYETNTPFQINPHTGNIFTVKKLNYDKRSSYMLHVEAFTGNGICFANTSVQVDVLNVNKHRPAFVRHKYHCRIYEKTGRVKIWPQIKVRDLDTGEAGKIKNVHVKESQEPFFVRFKKSTNDVLVKAVPGYEFSADRMALYKFTLQAWDAGDPPRNSVPLRMQCSVVPHNKHAPVFMMKEYVGRVTQGKNNPSIVKVKATDMDKGKFGKVCEYFIRTSDIPFSINNRGVVSLKKPLDKDAPDNYVFVVMAKDCGGKVSDEGAMVNVIVDKDCTPGFVVPKKRSPKLKGCEGVLQLTPKIRLNGCGESRLYGNFTATIQMQTNHILRGCDRETYEASGIFKMCKVNKTIDLLPSGKQGHQWMKALLTDKDIEGENLYEFDGKTALNVPPHVVEYYGRESMTISTWIWMEKKNNKQFILAATDSQRLNRKHFGLYTEGDQLVFIHRQEPTSGDAICKSRFTWKPKIFDISWHHVVVTVNGCKAARLFVDAKEVTVEHTKEDWPLHGSNMANRIVIGARWFGGEQKYGEYFKGYLADLSLTMNEAVDEKAITCVFECKEKIKIDIPAPDGFHVQQKSHDTIAIHGQGRPETFEKLLRGLVYVNTRHFPTFGRRPLQIHATVNGESLPMIGMDVFVLVEDKLLALSGAEKKTTDVAELRKYGIPIARKLTITSSKCSKYLDFAKVEVNPPLNTDESLVNPGPLLDLYNLKKEKLDGGKGIIIRGLAKVEEYQKVLREIVFVNLAPEQGIRHTFKFSVSDLNKRFISNDLETKLRTVKSGTKQPYDMQAINRQEKEALPGAVKSEVFVAETSGKSFGTMIGVIVASACVFVFIILVIVIRLRSEATVVYSDVPQNEPEVSTKEEKTVMNVTLNPLEKFDDVDLKDNEEPMGKPLQETKAEKMNLEWDDAYIA